MFLLDTHILLWFLNDDPKLSLEVKEILNSKQAIFISIASFWEMAIKESIGKLTLPKPITSVVSDCKKLGFFILPIEPEHLALLKSLPAIHRDPFDRLLICQAKSEDMILITEDENILRYQIATPTR